MSDKTATIEILDQSAAGDNRSMKHAKRRANSYASTSALAAVREGSPVYEYLIGLSAKSRKSQICALRNVLATTELGKPLQDCAPAERAELAERIWFYPWNRIGRKRFKGMIIAQRELGYAGNTIQRNMSAVRRVMDLCTEPDYQGTRWAMSREDYSAASKSNGLPKIKLNRGGLTGRAFTESELRDLFTACEIRDSGETEHETTAARDKGILALLFLRGMRVSEVVALKISNYNPRTGQISIKISKTETGLRIILADAAKMYLDKWLKFRTEADRLKSGAIFYQVHRNGRVQPTQNDEQVLSNNAVRSMLIKRCEIPNINSATTHDGRRTAITWQYENGGLAAAQALAGHASPEQTLKYLRYSAKEHAKARENLYRKQAEVLGFADPEELTEA